MFTRTKHGANRLTKQLQQDGVEAAAIHGNKSQSARTQALADFKNFRIRALVATEVASRGLDIKELPHVVNYELPNVPEDYVHRIGRTGRAGATGIAVSLVSADEAGLAEGHRTAAAQADPAVARAAIHADRESARRPFGACRTEAIYAARAAARATAPQARRAAARRRRQDQHRREQSGAPSRTAPRAIA